MDAAYEPQRVDMPRDDDLPRRTRCGFGHVSTRSLEQFIEAHTREHVAHPDLTDEERAQGAEDLLQAIRRYSK